MKLRITFIITAMEDGGAVSMLKKVLLRLDRNIFTPTVISMIRLREIGRMASRELGEMDIPVLSAGMRRNRVPNLENIKLLAKHVAQSRPDLVQTWLYHSDLLGGMTTKLSLRCPVIWNIRHCNLDPAFNKRTTLWIARLCGLLSWVVPDKIVICARSACTEHLKFGYAEKKMVVIPNGFDLDRFKPSGVVKAKLRRELGLPEGVTLIGHAGRFDPLKDHETLLKAAGRVFSDNNDIHFVLCGNDVTYDNARLAGYSEATGRPEAVHLLGHRNSMEHIIPGFDILVQSSTGEGFPNIIGEAMACEVPCVVTDVGDSAWVVGKSGIAVPPKSSRLLAAGIQRMLDIDARERTRLGQTARERIRQEFSLDKITGQYENLFLEVAYSHNRGATNINADNNAKIY